MFNFLSSLAVAAEQTNNAPAVTPLTPTSTGTIPPTASYNIMQIMSQLLPFILIAVIFYLFIIRPQNQQRKQLANMINNLKSGDKVITKGGIIGKISDIKENTLILELHDGTRVELLKHAVISMLDGEGK
jgi:preprotein translocase subunit YajC